jgi:formate transporter
MNDSTNAMALDGLLPSEIAVKAENAGVKKGRMPLLEMFLLAVLAGAFIAMGGVFYTAVVTGNGMDGAVKLPFGVLKSLGGLAFCLGLILVVVAGAELFTGNNLIVMAVASGKLPVSSLARNWVAVYAGNFAGAVATAYIMYLTAQYSMAGGAVGVTAMELANAKCALPFVAAMTRGIYCNALVCLAVWLCFSCRTTTDKILAIIFPITAFVTAGFEHSVANMYFVPVGIFIKTKSAYWASMNVDVTQFNALNWNNFLLVNLLPVTIGNIIGGSLFVGAVYWLIYCKGARTAGIP